MNTADVNLSDFPRHTRPGRSPKALASRTRRAREVREFRALLREELPAATRRGI